MRTVTSQLRKAVRLALTVVLIAAGAASGIGCGSDGEVGLMPGPDPTPERAPSLTPLKTSTPTITPSGTITPTRTRTPTWTAAGTATTTATPSRTGTPTISLTPTISGTPTQTPTVTRTPTITKTPTHSPTPRATPGPGNVRVDVGSGVGFDGGTVEIEVVLESGDRQVTRVTHDVVFDPALVNIPAPASDCRINPEISAAQDGCVEQPQVGPCKSLLRNLATCPASGCPAGLNGRKRLGIDLKSAVNQNRIPSGLLYTCTFSLAEGVSAATVLLNLNVATFGADGTRLPSAGLDGMVTIQLRPTPTPTVPPPSNCCIDRVGDGTTGCEDADCETCVCTQVPGAGEFCCTDAWDALCAEIAAFECRDVCPCN